MTLMNTKNSLRVVVASTLLTFALLLSGCSGGTVNETAVESITGIETIAPLSAATAEDVPPPTVGSIHPPAIVDVVHLGEDWSPAGLAESVLLVRWDRAMSDTPLDPGSYWVGGIYPREALISPFSSSKAVRLYFDQSLGDAGLTIRVTEGGVEFADGEAVWSDTTYDSGWVTKQREYSKLGKEINPFDYGLTQDVIPEMVDAAVVGIGTSPSGKSGAIVDVLWSRHIDPERFEATALNVGGSTAEEAWVDELDLFVTHLLFDMPIDAVGGTVRLSGTVFDIWGSGIDHQGSVNAGHFGEKLHVLPFVGLSKGATDPAPTPTPRAKSVATVYARMTATASEK